MKDEENLKYSKKIRRLVVGDIILLKNFFKLKAAPKY